MVDKPKMSIIALTNVLIALFSVNARAQVQTPSDALQTVRAPFSLEYDAITDWDSFSNAYDTSMGQLGLSLSDTQAPSLRSSTGAASSTVVPSPSTSIFDIEEELSEIAKDMVAHPELHTQIGEAYFGRPIENGRAPLAPPLNESDIVPEKRLAFESRLLRPDVTPQDCFLRASEALARLGDKRSLPVAVEAFVGRTQVANHDRWREAQGIVRLFSAIPCEETLHAVAYCAKYSPAFKAVADRLPEFTNLRTFDLVEGVRSLMWIQDSPMYSQWMNVLTTTPQSRFTPEELSYISPLWSAPPPYEPGAKLR